MTITHETLIHCDGDDCPLGGEPLGSGDDRSRPAKIQLRGEGWLVRHGKHYCPHCRDDLANTEASP